MRAGGSLFEIRPFISLTEDQVRDDSEYGLWGPGRSPALGPKPMVVSVPGAMR